MFSKNVFHHLSSAIQFCASPESAMWIEIAGYQYGRRKLKQYTKSLSWSFVNQQSILFISITMDLWCHSVSTYNILNSTMFFAGTRARTKRRPTWLLLDEQVIFRSQRQRRRMPTPRRLLAVNAQRIMEEHRNVLKIKTNNALLSGLLRGQREQSIICYVICLICSLLL